MNSMFHSAKPMGHFSPQQMQAATMALAMVTPELEKLKMMPVVHTELYLDVLNRLIEPLAIKQGFDGRVTWLGEVQLLIIRLKQRSCAGVPLYIHPSPNIGAVLMPDIPGSANAWCGTRNAGERSVADRAIWVDLKHRSS